jgi:hypothetical protein
MKYLYSRALLNGGMKGLLWRGRLGAIRIGAVSLSERLHQYGIHLLNQVGQ